MTEKEVAETTRLALSTLRNARSRGKLLPYVKVGGCVRYLAADVESYVAAHRILPRNGGGKT